MSRKVLIVDDEPPIRTLLRMGPATLGGAVLDAPGARTALALLGCRSCLLSSAHGAYAMPRRPAVSMMRTS